MREFRRPRPVLLNAECSGGTQTDRWRVLVQADPYDRFVLRLSPGNDEQKTATNTASELQRNEQRELKSVRII